MMWATVLIDTGPLVALTHRRDQYHQWAQGETDKLKAPFLTCEAVWSEAWFLLQQLPMAQAKLLRLFEEELVQIGFNASDETINLSNLLRRYANIPMSVADACLVRMSELHSDCVFTTDSDFNIYRRHGNQQIPTILCPKP